jgi:PAS domain S-box-containing protein
MDGQQGHGGVMNSRAAFLPLLLRAGLLALVYIATARLGNLLAFPATHISPVWPPSGIALAALFLYGTALWPGVLAGAFLANLWALAELLGGVTSASLVSAFSIGVGNTLQAVVGTLLFRRVTGEHGRISDIQNVYRFGLVAVLVSLVAAGVGSVAMIAAGIAPESLRWALLATWWLGDVAGILIVAPVLLAWSAPRRFDWSARLVAEMLVSLLLLALGTVLVFSPAYAPDGLSRAAAYLLIPAIAWAAYRHGARGATLSCLVIATITIVATSRGHGPFASGTMNDALFSVQSYVALCSLVGMVLCVDMAAMRRRRGSATLLVRVMAHWSVLFLGLGVTVFVWTLITSATERNAREQFGGIVAEIRQRIDERMDNYEMALRSTRALFAASDEVQRTEWRIFVEAMGVSQHFPGIQGIGYARVFPASERAAFESRVRATGLAGFRVWPADPRAEYSSIVYLEPFNELNQRALGFDMLSEPVRRAAMMAARASGQTALSGKVRLVQEPSGESQAGFLMYLPVYRAGAPLRTEEERLAGTEGLVYSPFRMNNLMRGILPRARSDVMLEVFDGTQVSEASRMYASHTRGPSELRMYPNPLSARTAIDLQQHQWTMRVTALGAFEQRIDRQKSQIVLVAGTIISLLLFGVVRSLSARQEYAANLAEEMRAAFLQSERKFESLVDAAIGFAIIATDLEGRIRVFSTGAQRMLGYRADELLGLPILTIHEPAEVAARAAALGAQLDRALGGFETLTAQAARDKPDQHEWTYIGKGGDRTPVSVAVTAIRDAGGAISGYLAVAHDITRQRFLQASLMRARDQAEAASRAKSEFVANMSHEIRTPMNAVLGISHLLDQTPLNAAQRRYLDMVRRAGQSLLAIINDVLDFSKIEAGRMELSPMQFNLNDVLGTVASIMTANGTGKPLELAIAVDAQVAQQLQGDAMRLQQILSNLVSNALKFTERGEVVLEVREHSRSSGQVVLDFVVRDSGIGMAEDQLGRLFTAFTQADASMTRRFGGTGLGLAISRNLADLMGGSIEVQSQAGIGSRFTLRLPFKLAPAKAVPVPEHLRHLRLLIADDHPASLLALGEAVRASDWRSVRFDSGPALMEHLELLCTSLPYDALLVDVGLLNGAGGISAQSLAACCANAVLPLLVLHNPHETGYAEGLALPERAALLAKPVTADSLRAALDRLLAPASTEEGPASAAEGGPLSHRRFLLVEDNELNRAVATGLLQAQGARVEQAHDGAEAVQRLRDDNAFDMVLMDVQMPVMDGLAATRMIRRELGLTLPVLAMSAGVMASERQQCAAAGMDDFIGKPVDPREMLDIILRHLRGPEPEHAQAAQGAVSKGESAFDVESLLDLTGHDPAQQSMLVNLIGKTINEAGAQMEAARAAWAEGRAGDAGRALHQLRGALGTLGAKRFVRTSLELEARLKDEGKREGVQALFDEATLELGRTVAEARAWLASRQGRA